MDGEVEDLGAAGETPANGTESKMRGIKTVIGCALSVAISGCAETYIKDGITPQELAQDNAYCQMVAVQAGGQAINVASGIASGLQRREAQRYCLISKGYRKQ